MFKGRAEAAGIAAPFALPPPSLLCLVSDFPSRLGVRGNRNRQMTGLVAGFGPGHIPTAPALLYSGARPILTPVLRYS